MQTLLDLERAGQMQRLRTAELGWIQQAALDAIAIGAAKRVSGELLLGQTVALTESLKALLLHSAELAKMVVAAKAYAVEHQGATKNILAALDQQITS